MDVEGLVSVAETKEIKWTFVMTDDNRAFELYENRSGRFSKIFTGVVITSLFIFFVILLPYVLVLWDQNRIKNELDTLIPSYDAYLRISENLNELRLEIVTLPDQIVGINNVNTSERVSAPYCHQVLHNIQQWKECSLRYMIRDASNKANSLLDQIMRDIRILNSNQGYVEIYQKLTEDPNFSLQPQHIEVYPELILFDLIDPINLKSIIPQLYTDYVLFSMQSNILNNSNGVDKEYILKNVGLPFLSRNPTLFAFQIDDKNIRAPENIGEDVMTLDSRVSNLQGNLTEKRNELQNIESRLEGFESPFGVIPLGFTEIVLIFPFGLALGTFVSFRSLSDAEKFRNYAFAYENPTNSSCSRCKDEYIKTAPLWYEFSSEWKKQKFQFLLLLVPGAIFISSMILIIIGWFIIPGSSTGSLAYLLETIWYWPLYVLSIVLMYNSYQPIFGKKSEKS